MAPEGNPKAVESGKDSLSNFGDVCVNWKLFAVPSWSLYRAAGSQNSMGDQRKGGWGEL